MNSRPLLLIALSFSTSAIVPFAGAQQPSGIKFLADTRIIQADGGYEADPHLATLSFDISAQDKDVKTAYDRASESVQKILALAQNNGVAPSDISGGVLTIRPFYEGDRKKRARSFLEGQLTLKVRDFAKLESILQNSVEDGIADFRSLTYSLSDEETAEQKAVAEAMQRSSDRANAALRPRGQKAGALRFVNVDVNQLTGLSEIILQDAGWTAEHFDAALPAKMSSPLRHRRLRNRRNPQSTLPLNARTKFCNDQNNSPVRETRTPQLASIGAKSLCGLKKPQNSAGLSHQDLQLLISTYTMFHTF